MCIKRSLPLRAAGRAMFNFIAEHHDCEVARSLLGKWDQQESKFHNTLMDQRNRKTRKRENIRKQKARGVR